MAYPLDRLLDELSAVVSSATHDDAVMSEGDPEEFRLVPSNFREIPATDNPRRVAFVDGGNGVLAQSPGFVVAMNRLYSCMFRGGSRVAEFRHPRVEFFSLVSGRVAAAEGGLDYDVRLFPYSPNHRAYLPDGGDVAASVRRAGAGDARTASLARSLGEWRTARVVAGTLGSGDVLVMDGSLMTLDRTESRYAEELYETARERGVVVCALSKSSRLLTRGGEPLLERVRSISRETGLGRWHVDVADRISAHDRGFVMAVQLHPGAPYAFRFEILREQHAEMDGGEKSHILASLAANSGDMAFLGYPYGLVDADRYAQVRRRDLQLCRGLLKSRTRAMAGIDAYVGGATPHDRLNGVTS